MSIRQVRISSEEKIRKAVSQYVGKKITLVLADQTSVLGELLKVDDKGVTLKVVVNAWTKKMPFEFHQINELYFDQIV